MDFDKQTNGSSHAELEMSWLTRRHTPLIYGQGMHSIPLTLIEKQDLTEKYKEHYI